ncbi:MAG: ribbon-helix-helix protein, CopG family [Candidatus Merdivicinus sp.]|jgi:predicted transcriptional regulator
MGQERITISKKRGEDGYRVVSVRMREETLRKLDEITAKTNRSRNELINILVEAAIDIVVIEDD